MSQASQGTEIPLSNGIKIRLDRDPAQAPNQYVLKILNADGTEFNSSAQTKAQAHAFMSVIQMRIMQIDSEVSAGL